MGPVKSNIAAAGPKQARSAKEASSARPVESAVVGKPATSEQKRKPNGYRITKRKGKRRIRMDREKRLKIRLNSEMRPSAKAPISYTQMKSRILERSSSKSEWAS